MDMGAIRVGEDESLERSSDQSPRNVHQAAVGGVRSREGALAVDTCHCESATEITSSVELQKEEMRFRND